MKYRIERCFEYNRENIVKLNEKLEEPLKRGMYLLVDKNGNIYTDASGYAPIYVSISSTGKKGGYVVEDAQAFFITYAKENGIELKMGHRGFDCFISRGDAKENLWKDVKGLSIFNVKKNYETLCDHLYKQCSKGYRTGDTKKCKLCMEMLVHLMEDAKTTKCFEVEKDEEKTTDCHFFAKEEPVYEKEDDDFDYDYDDLI